jgi:hypothetical protein
MLEIELNSISNRLCTWEIEPDCKLPEVTGRGLSQTISFLKAERQSVNHLPHSQWGQGMACKCLDCMRNTSGWPTYCYNYCHFQMQNDVSK